MHVIINGAERELDRGTTVEAVVQSLTTNASGVAVALNDAVVPRAEWPRTEVGEHDRVDVLTAVQGG